MSEENEDEVKHSRRRDDNSLTKTLLPWILGLLTVLASSAFSFAFKTSQDVAIIKDQLSRQGVNPIEFGKMQVKIENLEAKGKEVHDTHQRELDNLRAWMRGHRHGGTVMAPFDEPPPASAVVPPQP